MKQNRLMSVVVALALALPLLGGDFDSWPKGKEPSEISGKLTDLLLSTRPESYKPEGYESPQGYAKNGYGNGRHVQYSVVSLWVNALECAKMKGDKVREEKLIRLYDDFLPGGRLHGICSNPYHVDFTIFGSIPLQIYLHNGDKRCLEHGLFYADTQWTPPCEGTLTQKHAHPKETQERFWAEGYTPQTRLWIDDMYMIIAIQSQAFRATGDRKYIDRTAKEMCLYIDELQVKDGKDKGLFYHAPDVPFVWGRGAGWMAAGMSLVLEYVPANSPCRAKILEGYRLMMAALLERQRPNGMWNQLVGDPKSWEETSCTAMYGYAFATGVKNGFLDAKAYGPAARKAYLALCDRIDARGNVRDVCCGTGKKNDYQYYLDRPHVHGDPHGQCALMWMCRTFLEMETKGRPVFSCDHADAIYAAGEKARIVAKIRDAKGRPVATGRFRFTLNNFGDKVLETREVDVAKDGDEAVFEGTSEKPGFLRLDALRWNTTQRKWEQTGCFGVAFSPREIRPGAECPADFNAFWKDAKAKYDREVTAPIKATKIDEKAGVALYELEIPTVGGRSLWGYLQEPTDAGKDGKTYPVIVSVPGAGPSSVPELGNYKRSDISLFVNVHYYHPFRGQSKHGKGNAQLNQAQRDEDEGWAKRYPVKNVRYTQVGIAASREEYFYYGVILGVNRAVDWTAARPGVDRSRFRYNGTSQGGGFGLILCGLNGNFTRATVYVPALTDLLGFKADGRESGWPRLIEGQLDGNKAAAERNAPYFCGVNFARNITFPIRFEVGGADTVCPPMAGFSAFNVTPSKDKDIVMGVGQGHAVFPELKKKHDAWLYAE